MTSNDKEIDVLLTRFAKGVTTPAAIDHLDADELNSFAEGKLPAAARQQYVSHLADCNDCRKLVSQLAVATGAATDARVPASKSAAESWWQKLSILLAPAMLRYAAFAVVLLGVVGIALVVWRRPAEPNRDLIAQSQPESPVVKAPALGDENNAKGYHPTPASGAPKATTAADAVAPVAGQKSADATGAAAPPPPKPADTSTENETRPALAAKAPESPRAEASPSYAPAPQSETFRADNRAREQQNLGNLQGGPRRNENYDRSKVLDNNRAGEVAKAKDGGEDRVLGLTRPAKSENKADDAPAARAGTASSVAVTGSGRDAKERDEARKREAAQATSEEASETRAVGGRKFKRQGNAWIDAKFKSSMSTRNVARGSEEFAKLDSGLRSIAQQLGGEIIVVWKGKAYRIR